MDKIFPNLKECVALKDNSYLSKAVKKIQMPTENLQLLNILSHPKIMPKKIFLVLANLPKRFSQISHNIFK